MATWLILFIGYMVLVVLLFIIMFVAYKQDAKKREQAKREFDANKRGREAFKEVFGKEPTWAGSKKK